MTLRMMFAVGSLLVFAFCGCGGQQAQDDAPPAARPDAEPAAPPPPAGQPVIVPPVAKPDTAPPDDALTPPVETAPAASPDAIPSPATPTPPESAPALTNEPPAAMQDDPLEPANPLRGDPGAPQEPVPAPAVPPLERAVPDAATPPAAPAGSETSPPAAPPSAGVPPAAGTPPVAGDPPKRKGKHSGIPFDPIKENGPIFEGWPKPKLALIITGREDGYLEPCGCAGLDRMKGGMARRHTLFRTLRDQGWPVIGLDVGGIAKGFGKQSELKFQTMVEGKRKMDYDAIAFGANDLKLPAGELVAVAASADDQASAFLSANVGLFGFDAGVTPKSKIITRPSARLGVTAVLGKQWQKQINNDEIEFADPEKALREIVPELKKQSNYLVLLAHATLEESIELAKQFPEFNMVVTAGGPAEPPAKLRLVEGTKTVLVEVGEKGMNAVVIGFFDDPQTPVRYQRVPLDSRFASSTEMKMLLQAYQEQVKTLGLAGLNIRAVPHPQVESHGKFVGSQKCESCHEESNRVWKRTGHAKAFETLVNLDPPRHHDPECISCHVIGWHPTKYFPYETGFVSKEKTPELIDVGCENCHGPGEKHVSAEMGADLELQKRLRQAMVITKEESANRQCYTCHDLDNSPDFDFDAYWPIVEHYEDIDRGP